MGVGGGDRLVWRPLVDLPIRSDPVMSHYV